MNQERIGKFIKDLRKKHNLSQVELAEKLGVTFQAVSKWENGKNLPDISTLKEIRNIFNVDIDDIIDGKIKKEKNNKKILLIIGGIVILLTIIIILISILNNNSNYEFNELNTTNNEFSISGSVVRSDKRTSLIVNKVDYHGALDNTIYKSLGCSLYEEMDNIKTEVSKCDNKENMTLTDYLENLKVKMDYYSDRCTMFTSSKLYIEISVVDEVNKTIIYKIPLELGNDC